MYHLVSIADPHCSEDTTFEYDNTNHKTQIVAH